MVRRAPARAEEAREPVDDPRASPEAIRKRRAARKLNDLLSGSSAKDALDGRTELKRKRLLAELERNTNNRNKPLKPVEVLSHGNELLAMGETLATLRKLVRLAPPTVTDRASIVAMLREVHEAYGFRPEVYELLGLAPELLAEADLRTPAPRRGRPRREPAR